MSLIKKGVLDVSTLPLTKFLSRQISISIAHQKKDNEYKKYPYLVNNLQRN